MVSRETREGSSPLARGLLGADQSWTTPARIIPARAGFTSSPPTAREREEDHPRSRGVYTAHELTLALSPGSSPLARGLPPSLPNKPECVRIIPARAGFTLPPQVCLPHHTDHPRSRGVYWTPLPARPTSQGSSPLARGLRVVVDDEADVPGIIPARAGFTPLRPVEHGPAADHPRSRGVYAGYQAGATPGGGSSPLARGLRPPQGRRLHRQWIIPARAGFTRRSAAPGPGRRDHPRSRGVYHPSAGRRVPPGGSSPLARGLLSVQDRPDPCTGIIPARAGFTALRRRRRRRSQDHPRSRGVYGPVRASRCASTGSSPLARGLPRAAIRPATYMLDHPRSRGVYITGLATAIPNTGSSPLARGLRADTTKVTDEHRIIPARAGFTPLPWGSGPASADHPRSRGVYACESLESQRTRSLPDPRRLHCRPRARSAELR